MESLRDDFDTNRAMGAILNLVHNCHGQLNRRSKDTNIVRSPDVMAVIAIYVKKVLKSLGVELSTRQEYMKDDHSYVISQVMDTVTDFRKKIRNFALCKTPSETYAAPHDKIMDKNKKKERQVLLKACDEMRDKLSPIGIQLKDHGDESTWAYTENKDTR
ncbi:putative cysteine--tRNA ligase, mitochondrial [Saccoglossus kowalevskii]|uniref:Probable cysteine--tRNA ligase, mitochondrial-like n=1 Tax=Saccoglossus kowalevskii TaxID=10224 RepID=A0ABM0MA05_SACKO|nr:PREDICTED: probable cysteine--tRNA ligase, mitochondrial-like [Saccoglossus kowalevskii]